MSIKYITLEKLLELKENQNKFHLVEVLDNESFDNGHIPGAINIPLDQLEGAAQKLEKTDPVIVYCSSYSCHASTKAAKKLQELGFSNVMDFKAGKNGWRKAGLELEEGIN